jgi:surface antigen
MRSRLSRLVATVLVVAFAFPVLSCQTLADKTRENPKAVLGSLGGAAVGAGIAALAHGNPAAIVASAVGGALLGGYLGHRLDRKDKELAAQAAARAFESNRTGQAAAWKNPDSGNSGSITPTKTYQGASGQYCREYRQDVVIDGELQEAYGTACRRADGTWDIQ